MTARGLSRHFSGGGGQGVEAVRDATLTVRAGEVVLVLGPSGSGKTTLLSMIGGILAPGSGALDVCGRDLGALAEKDLPRFRLRNVGFVFQTHRLLDALTAGENVELPLHLAGRPRSDSRARSRTLLEELGVADRAEARTDVLSAGERQRVAVARALALDPPLLLADEPTGSLDTPTGEKVMDLLCGAARRRAAALVMVSHDERLRSRAGRVMVMEDGVLRSDDGTGRRISGIARGVPTGDPDREA